MADVPETRDQAFRAFERARAEFKQAYRDVPDAALHYLPEGDDYALGGLIVHVANAMENYVKVIGAMKAEGFRQLKAAEGSGETPEMLEALKHGFDGPERSRHWARLDRVHAALVDQVNALAEQDFSRTAPIIFGHATEPLPTSAAMIMGWMIDHYRDHVGQVRDMLAEWTTDEQPT
ncbi:MAG TPA: DinB family protein [Chloroflexota bacterium]|jgi:DinB family protein|nr:DinB family protein [Chloroflexota bacterium]